MSDCLYVWSTLPPHISLCSNTDICRQERGLHANERSLIHTHFLPIYVMLLCKMQLPPPYFCRPLPPVYMHYHPCGILHSHHDLCRHQFVKFVQNCGTGVTKYILSPLRASTDSFSACLSGRTFIFTNYNYPKLNFAVPLKAVLFGAFHIFVKLRTIGHPKCRQR